MRCSVEGVFLQITQNSQENNCARVSFLIKLQASAFFTENVLATASIDADIESRSSETRTEWNLNESYFQSILNHFRSNQIQMLKLSMHLP